MEPLTEHKYRGFTIQVYPDLDAPSPREWDNLGTMVCFHRRYDLGDLGGSRRSLQGLSFCEPSEFRDWLKTHKSFLLPLYLYDHSGLLMSTSNSQWPFNCRWDSGQVGWIFVEREKAQAEYQKADLKAQDLEKSVYSALRAEVQVYNYYLAGEIFGWVILTPSGEDVDSCWGYYGSDLQESGLLTEARAAVDAYIQSALKTRAKLVKGWIRHRVPLIYRTPMAL